MGLMLCPADDEVAGPDVSWSYYGFNLFREWLAQAEGFTLREMVGFGGGRPWGDVTTALAPLLDHPDDGGELAPAQCAAVLPRLKAIVDGHAHTADSIVQRRVDDTRQLIDVMKYCLDEDVPLCFC
ncbi:hypothetical protein [Streptomyces sp. NPDC051993]|uniref:hypothetical protein n=1 Tax=unclassified Streptomyces TaxID=2593676 RepID=UPI003431D0E0